MKKKKVINQSTNQLIHNSKGKKNVELAGESFFEHHLLILVIILLVTLNISTEKKIHRSKNQSINHTLDQLQRKKLSE